ncbi:MAG: AMP-binding protein [Gammaproteobacteria bacterium]|nr:AMP-binding protein [Gammaproteobacteria bacterium]
MGLCMSRSPALLASLLGILEAGAAYVALDPSYPPARLTYMVSDSRVRLAFVDASTVPQAAFEGVTLLRADVLTAMPVAPGSDARDPLCVDEEELAYVLYTSGSTGYPKAWRSPAAACRLSSTGRWRSIRRQTSRLSCSALL